MFIAEVKRRKDFAREFAVKSTGNWMKIDCASEQFSVLLRLIPLYPSSLLVEVIIVFNVIGCDEVEKVV